ncbi:MAG: response regulator transcription factor [Chloroflexi bacterium]|nr:response regulator transcription factor [Chloroflexota bacterium]
MSKGKILLVDDEKKILSLVRAYLEREGYQVIEATDGQQGLEAFRRESPDLIVLDLMLPKIDGLEVCREIRRTSSVPIIMLTARDEDIDKLVGLELGADDYITKPFSPRELVARIRAVLRRSHPAEAAGTPAARLTLGELVMDEGRFEATCHGQLLALTPAEFRILAALARVPGRVLSRGQLLDSALGESYEGYERTIDVHIKNLRHKMAAAGAGEGCGILTVYGIGYKIKEPDHA